MFKYSVKILSLLLIVLLSLSGCSGKSEGENTSVTSEESAEFLSDIPTIQPQSELEKTKASAKNKVSGAGTTIALNGDTANISGNGAKSDGKDIVITKGGSYAVSGRLNNGRIVVNAGSGKVTVILNGAHISCGYSSAFYVKKAGEVTLTAYDGSVNLLMDAGEYSFSDSYSSPSNSTPDACVYSDDNITVNGGGELVVVGNYKNGLTGKSTLDIEKIKLSVESVGHGITGKERLNLNGAEFNIIAAGDGLRANETANASLGVVTLKNSKGSIVAKEDGIQAETTLAVESGSYAIQSGDGSEGTPTAETSAKGLKGGSAVNISGGSISSDSLDDALHSNGNINISGGELSLKSGDDGIHADGDINILGGIISVSKCYEGLEATNVALSGGSVKVVASDDGVNVSGGDGSGEMGRPGMDRFMSSSGGKLTVSAGLLQVNAEGDGLDANGNIEISGGTVIVDGPTRGGNGVLDFDGECLVTGGSLIAVGSSDMAQTPSQNSTQNTLVYTSFSEEGGSLFNIQSSDGTELITYRAAKGYSWICYSSPKIKKGESYLCYVGGSHTGTESGRIFTGGKYTAGTKVAELTVSSTVTSNGEVGGMGGPHGNMGGHRGGMGRPYGFAPQ